MANDWIWRSYYYAGGMRVAVRESTSTTSGVVYLFTDHLGSVSVRAWVDGSTVRMQEEMKHKPCPCGVLREGSQRTGPANPPSGHRYIGQRWESPVGLYFYNARWYDPYIAQFSQPDNIVFDPYNPLVWNRYNYVLYNPINHNDLTGHMPSDGCGYEGCSLVNKEQSQRIVIENLLKNGKTWNQLPGGYRSALEDAGFTKTSYSQTEMSMSHGVRNAYWYEDPATYISATGGGGLAAITKGAIIRALIGGEAYDCITDGQCPAINLVEGASDKVVTVIGKYPANKELAGKIGGNWLNDSMTIWNLRTAAENIERNKQWLQEAVIRGDIFRLASPISEATPGSGFLRELEYLFSLGYQVTSDGKYLFKP